MITFSRHRVAAALSVGLLLTVGGNDSALAAVHTSPPEQAMIQPTDPPCITVDWVPFHNIQTTCIEVVYDRVTPPEAAPDLVGLALDADGTLYIARTATGEIWAQQDTDGDHYLDDPQRVAAGLNLPTHVTVHEGALIVASVGGLLRLEPDGAGQFTEPVVLVADLGGDPRQWPGAVHVGPDGRLYVGLGGELASFAPDGRDRRIEAITAGAVTDFTWHPTTGDLWLLDGDDALFRVPRGAVDAPDFSAPPYPPDTVIFPDQSAPVGLAFYPAGDWTYWQGDLIVALKGSWNRPEPAGYAVMVVGMNADGLPDGTTDWVAPASESTIWQRPLTEFSLGRRGFFPYHPSSIVISPEGWLYVGIQEGRIFRLRPRPAA